MPAARRHLTVLAALGATACATLGAGLAAGAARKPKPKITAAGVGAVSIGANYAELRKARLIGPTSAGCKLAGPKARAAALLAPVKGSAALTQTRRRTIQTITVRGGATAHGVAIGAPIAKVTKAFPKAVVDHGTDATFGVTLVKIPHNGGGRLQFAVSVKTQKVKLIGIPKVAFCD